MLSFLLSFKAHKLSRPPLLNENRSRIAINHQSNAADDCIFRYYCDGRYDLNGIVNLYSKFGVTKKSIIDANPGVSLSYLQGLYLTIPYKCGKVIDKYLYMDSPEFTDKTIAKNGSALLSYCFMSFNYKTAAKCEQLLNYMRFNSDGTVKNSYTIESMCFIRKLDGATELDDSNYELREYTIDGHPYYAVQRVDGFYDPGRFVIDENPGAPYKSTYFQEE